MNRRINNRLFGGLAEGLTGFLELTGLLILANIIPGEITAVHGHVNADGEGLCEGEGAAQVKESVGAAKFIRDHGACEDNGLAGYFFRQDPGRDGHGIGAMGDDDLVFHGRTTLMGNEFAVFIGDVEAIDHHQGPYRDVQGAAAALEHFRQVCLFKKEFPGELVILFIEGASGDKNADIHAGKYTIVRG